MNVCPQCAREIRGDVPRCFTCGWSKDPRLQEAVEAGRVQARTFFSGATFWPFIASAILLGALSILLVATYRWKELKGSEVLLGILACGAPLFFGPVLAAVQILRRRLIWVRIDPERGLEFSRYGLIPWERIASVERYPGVLAYQDSMESLATKVGFRTHGAGCAAVLTPIGCIALLFFIVYFVFVPVLVTISSGVARVTITLKDGQKIVLKDLEESGTFARMIGYKVG